MSFGKTEQICTHEHSSTYRKDLKKWKNRSERRKAKSNPEITPGYKIHYGYSI